jgi:hypothetical protein
MNIIQRGRRIEYDTFRPNLPKEWKLHEHLENVSNSYITFFRWGKLHHNAEPSKLLVIFCEFNPESEKSFRYTVRGGRHCKPDENLRHYKDLKDATSYLLSVMESTDKWLEEINSQSYIDAYNARIAKSVAEAERRKLIIE